MAQFSDKSLAHQDVLNPAEQRLTGTQIAEKHKLT